MAPGNNWKQDLRFVSLGYTRYDRDGEKTVVQYGASSRRTGIDEKLIRVFKRNGETNAQETDCS
jgi:hypothetical protein